MAHGSRNLPGSIVLISELEFYGVIRKVMDNYCKHTYLLTAFNNVSVHNNLQNVKSPSGSSPGVLKYRPYV